MTAMASGELRDRYDVIVVGAGPAGALAAHQLASAGRPVLLVERNHFPRYKVCGGCLNNRALSALHQAGLDGAVAAAGAAPLEQFALASRGRRVTLPLPGGWAISRNALDAVLAKEAEAAGAHVVYGAKAHRTENGAALRLTPESRSESINAACILAADGLGQRFMTGEDGPPDRVARGARIGAGVLLNNGPDAYASGTIYMAHARHGYVGLVRVEDRGLNVAAAFDPAFVKANGGLAAAGNAVLRDAGLPPLDPAAPWKGTPPLTRTPGALYRDHVLSVGDATGYVEPFTGEGMAWAMTGALDVAALIGEALDGRVEDLGTAWARRCIAAKRWPALRCRIIAAGLRRPSAVRGAIRVLAWAPGLARPVVRALNTPIGPSAKESP